MLGVNSDLIMECLTTITTLTRHERVTRKFSLQSSQGTNNVRMNNYFNIHMIRCS
jgi:hypothetical protein